MRIRMEDLATGFGVVLTDNGAGDLDARLGSVFFAGAVGGFGVNFTSGTSQPLIGGVYNDAELALGSTNIRTTSGSGQLRITLLDSGYGPDPGSRTVHGYAAGVMTGASTNTASFNAWASPSNLFPNFGPDDGFPVSLLGPIGALPPDAVAVWPGGVTFGLSGVPNCNPGCSTAFSGRGANTFVTPGYYSLFAELLLNLSGPSALSISQLNVAVTPEPSTLLLVGTGAVFLAYGRWRSKRYGPDLRRSEMAHLEALSTHGARATLGRPPLMERLLSSLLPGQASPARLTVGSPGQVS
jgi:hypothetical protein